GVRPIAEIGIVGRSRNRAVLPLSRIRPVTGRTVPSKRRNGKPHDRRTPGSRSPAAPERNMRSGPHISKCLQHKMLRRIPTPLAIKIKACNRLDSRRSAALGHVRDCRTASADRKEKVFVLPARKRDVGAPPAGVYSSGIEVPPQVGRDDAVTELYRLYR